MTKIFKKNKAASSRRWNFAGELSVRQARCSQLCSANFATTFRRFQEFFTQPTNRDHGDSHMVVEPKIGGKPPKWMVKIMENPMNKWMIWGVPLFLETPISLGIRKWEWYGNSMGQAYHKGVPLLGSP